MLLIECPYCGPRAQIEFTYGGDATKKRPADPVGLETAEWLNFVYLRDNPRGPHTEWWHHSAGCRRWIKVRRDTLTHDISASATPGSNLGDGST